MSRRKQNWHSKVRATESFDSGMTHYRSKGISKKSHSLRPKVFWIIQHQFVYLKWKSWLPKRLKYSLSLIFPISYFWQMGCVYGWKVNVPKQMSPYHQLFIKNPCAQLNDTHDNISSFDNCNQENQIAWKDPAPFLQFLKVTCNRATVNWDIFKGCKILQISCNLCNFLFFLWNLKKKLEQLIEMIFK